MVLAGALAVALACGNEAAPDDAAPAAAAASASVDEEAKPAASPREPSAASARASEPPRPGLGGRTRELVNPEALAMVLLYRELTGAEPPIARWIEEDFRVVSARPIDKPAMRETLKAEYEAAQAAVRDVGALRLTLHAALSDYDPSYGEFTVGALSPSQVVSFDAMREKVELRFANGLDAQVWKVPEADAQLIRDKLGPFGGASLDVLLRIVDVQPGGTIVTEVVEYELRTQHTGERLGNVRVGGGG
jgi:pyruvate/2-oxoglutarate dehydrogenase complex dihydrolipoamide acyltransferase (E2) component